MDTKAYLDGSNTFNVSQHSIMTTICGNVANAVKRAGREEMISCTYEEKVKKGNLIV